jgi:type III restriction enzyme
MAYVVDRVVVCDAYREPDRHYQLLTGGRSRIAEGRRPSMRFLASARATKGGIAGIVGKEATLFEDMIASEEQLNDFVNDLRDEVRIWRGEGYPGTAMVTRRLLEWWFERDEERRALGRRFFFCQQEAVETVIYLYEVKRRHKMPETSDLIRYALKLATGTGKTAVMALLVVWSTLHKHKVAGSSLSANFLVLVPNLTVRDRVRGVDERTGLSTGSGLDPASEENLYGDFEMVPPEYQEEFRPNVVVRNWQSIPLELNRDDWVSKELLGEGRFIPASVRWAIERRNRSDPKAAVRRLLGNWRDLVVINDEAHHVYGEKKTKAGEEPAYIRWNKIIDRIKEASSISLVVDMSATPWYGSGAAKPEGALFEWLVSDFSVYDAFESGLVKVVRLPDPDEEGHRYLNLWDLVSGARTKEEYIASCKGAIASIYASWKNDYLEWSSRFEDLRPGPPPVMLLVADRAERARWLFEHLTNDYEYLRNPDPEDRSKWVTVQVDSKVFDADRGNEAVLREMVNTVGQPEKPGEHVRCIVSVNMLSEGWDVKNVSHILGLRAFGSPLLTEQVIGRGLRRVDYSVLNIPLEEREANPNRPDEETTDAFGIPFAGFPVEKRKRPKVRGWGTKPVRIAPDPKKERYAVELPNVRSWAVGVSRPLVDAIPAGTLAELVIDPRHTPPQVRVKPVVGGEPEEILTLEEWRKENPLLRSKFELAKELYEGMTGNLDDELLVGPTYEELLEFVSEYVDERVRAIGASRMEDVGIYYWRSQARNVLETAIRGAPTETTTIPIFGDPPRLRTLGVAEFNWPGIVAEGKRCHWSKVPCHTELEAEFSGFLDAAPDVVRYIKNERLGFSLTYYEGGRPRQYFPDFAVLVSTAAGEAWWLAETKGEIRANTMVKREAAELWCDRMTRSGEGAWSHLFVPQRPFQRAIRSGLATFLELVQALKTAEPRLRLRLIPPDEPRVAAEAYKTLLPVYSLEAAAGYFGEGKVVELDGWIEVEGFKRLDDKMFVAKAIGRSMEPRIHDGDYLVFRAHPTGTRQGKIVLARGPITDPEIGGPYTVKSYSSEKVEDPETGWRHTRIILSPLSREFRPIRVETADDQASPVQIVAEYLGKLNL